MRFSEIKKFTGNTVEEALQYLTLMASGLRDLFAGLKFLDFGDNFQSFIWTGDVAAGKEIVIPHDLKVTPRYWIVADAKGTNEIVRGIIWGPTKVSLMNGTATDFSGTVIFFR